MTKLNFYTKLTAEMEQFVMEFKHMLHKVIQYVCCIIGQSELNYSAILGS